MVKQLHYRRCCGCGTPAKKLRVLVSLPAHTDVCDECILIMVEIVAKEAERETRIRFVEQLLAIMEEPVKVVAKWKEVEKDAANA